MNRAASVFIFLFPAILWACSPRIFPEAKILHTEKDSVIIKETIRDTSVLILPDSSLVQALVECDSLGKARLKELQRYREGKYIKPLRLELKDNKLKAVAEIDSFSVFIRYKNKYEQHFRITDRQKETVRIIETNKIYWWQKSLMWIGAIAILITFLFTFLKIKQK